MSEDQVRRLRKSLGISPVFKQIDTLAAEWPSITYYLYATYGGQTHDVRARADVLVIGAGVFRIGVSVEFDWGVMEFARAAKEYVDTVTIVNYNPETVSTDWDVVDRLYFEELTLERLLDIYEFESTIKVVTFLGGQVANDLAEPLESRGVEVLGTSGSSVEVAESRDRFSQLLDELELKQPPWKEVNSVEEALDFAMEHGYPVMVRPSHVLSGTSMSLAWDEGSLMRAVRSALSTGRSVVVSKFLRGPETEIDGVADGESVVGVVIRHIEPAGIHSGDSTMVLPVRGLPVSEMKEATLKLVRALQIRGPFNLQFVINGSGVYVLELNLRASRSMPFSSKASGVNLARAAAKVVFEGFLGVDEFYEPVMRHYAVKSPQFSWSQLRGAYPFLGVEMRSTGEVASMDRAYEAALLKSWLAVSPNRLPERGVVVGYEGFGEERGKMEAAADALASTLDVWWVSEVGEEEAMELLKEGRADMVIATGYAPQVDYAVRRLAADLNTPLVLNADLALELARAFNSVSLEEVEVKPMSSYARGYRSMGLLRRIPP